MVGKKSLLAKCISEIVQLFVMPGGEGYDAEANGLCLLRWFSSPAPAVRVEFYLDVISASVECYPDLNAASLYSVDLVSTRVCIGASLKIARTNKHLQPFHPALSEKRVDSTIEG